uniref:Cadherin-like protein 26 n=1 Tax=Latimeria chalumnae TaxID=7897 RepID=H3BD38_LATCH
RPLKRSKRRWVLDTIRITEEDNGEFPKKVAELGNTYNQSEENHIEYLISGEGVDTFPEVGLFSIDRKKGHVYVNRKVDREKTQKFTLRFDINDITKPGLADVSLTLDVDIEDINDNPPKFAEEEYSMILQEDNKPGNTGFRVNAVDNDKGGTPNAKVTYALVSQAPSSEDVSFSIDSKTGAISLKGCLNYQTTAAYKLIIKASDSGDIPLSSTSTINVKIEDRNNHAPVIVGKTNLSGKIPERNTNECILRIKVEDKDSPHTPAWRAKFSIKSGNENHTFHIETDPETNEGILSVISPLDFEDSELNSLLISVENEEPLFFCGQNPKPKAEPEETVSVTIQVEDINDPPTLTPVTIKVNKVEGVGPQTVLTQVNATDPDRREKFLKRFTVAKDPGGWVTVNEETGKVISVKELDRESPYVNNSIYTILVYAIDDEGEPPQTGTGTILLYLTDVNDNLPFLQSPYLEMCDDMKKPPLIIKAADEDSDPYSGPFQFRLLDAEDKINKNFKLGESDGNSVQLLRLRLLPTGNFSLPFEIEDLQGLTKKETLYVRVCTCTEENKCEEWKPSTVTLSGGAMAAIGCALLLLALALLLLCCCISTSSKFKDGCDQDSDGNQTLIKYNEESGGALIENADIARMVLSNSTETGQCNVKQWMPVNPNPAIHRSHTLNVSRPITPNPAMRRSHMLNGRQSSRSRMSRDDTLWMSRRVSNASLIRSRSDALEAGILRMIAGSVDKTISSVNERAEERITHEPQIYAFEGLHEEVASFDSLNIESDTQLDFLMDLGPKFFMLEEICQTSFQPDEEHTVCE